MQASTFECDFFRSLLCAPQFGQVARAARPRTTNLLGSGFARFRDHVRNQGSGAFRATPKPRMWELHSRGLGTQNTLGSDMRMAMLGAPRLGPGSGTEWPEPRAYGPPLSGPKWLHPPKNRALDMWAAMVGAPRLGPGPKWPTGQAGRLCACGPSLTNLIALNENPPAALLHIQASKRVQ